MSDNRSKPTPRGPAACCGASAKMVRPGGFEPPTSWSVARRSIQLSYGRTYFVVSGGEGGIRTLGEFPHTRLAGVRLQPLGHLSRKSGGGRGTRTPKGFHPAVFKTAALPIRTSPPGYSPDITTGVFGIPYGNMPCFAPSATPGDSTPRMVAPSAERHGTIWFSICQVGRPILF